MSDTTILGRFVWHELMTTDTTSAARFYAKVVGWTTQPSPQDPSYIVFVAKGRPTGGLMALPAEAKAMGAPLSWLTYIATPDVDETVQRALQMGGKILKAAADIPTVGRFAVLQDPQGAAFAAFTPAQGPMDAPRGAHKPTAGDFSWNELSTTDWAAVWPFYQSLFGWEKTGSTDMGPEMGTYQMFGWKGRTVGGMYNKPKSIPGPPHWLPYAMVVDSKKAVAVVTRLGGHVINGPMEVPGGDWVARCLDLQGALFAVHSPKPAAGKLSAAKKIAKSASAVKRSTKKSASSAAAVTRTAKKPVRKAKPARKAARKNAARRPKTRPKTRPKGRTTKGRR
jgi:predicted enzyme related to lactoylglutathione lyase